MINVWHILLIKYGKHTTMGKKKLMLYTEEHTLCELRAFAEHEYLQ